MTTAIAERVKNVQPDQIQGKTALRVMPILGVSHDQPEYRLLDEQTVSAVKVTETSESGSVPELRIENTLGVRVFLMDGQELVGAKQNRILNTDVLVTAGKTLTIPVSCVEAGRWHYTSSEFRPGSSASYRVRSGKQARVYEALKREGRYDAAQGAVWNDVQASLAASQSVSSTSALHDAYEARRKNLEEFRSSLKLPEEAVGLAVFHNAKFQGLDIFDRHSTLRYFWESLVDSYAIDWLMAPVEEAAADDPAAQAVRQTLERAVAGKWDDFPSPGEGRDYRLDDRALTGSALVWEDRVVVHLQLFPRPSENDEQSSTRRHRPRIHRPYTDGSGGQVVY